MSGLLLFCGKSKILSDTYQYEFSLQTNGALAKFKDTNQDNISNFKCLADSRFFIRNSKLGFVNVNKIEYPYVSYSQSDPVSFDGGVISCVGTHCYNGHVVYVLVTQSGKPTLFRLYNDGTDTYAQKCTGQTDSYAINNIFNELNDNLTVNNYVYLGVTSSNSTNSYTATVNSTNVSGYSQWATPVKVSGISDIDVNKAVGIAYVTNSMQSIALDIGGSTVGHTPVYAGMFTDIRGFLGESLKTDSYSGLLCKSSTEVCSVDSESIEVIYNHSDSTKIKLLDSWCFFDGATGYIYRSLRKGKPTPLSTQRFVDVELLGVSESDVYNLYLGLTAAGELYIVNPNKTTKVGSYDDGIYVAIKGSSAIKRLYM